MIRLVFILILGLSSQATGQGIDAEALLRQLNGPSSTNSNSRGQLDPLAFTRGYEGLDEDFFFEPDLPNIDSSRLAPSTSLRPQVRPDDLVPESSEVIAPMCGCGSACTMTSEYGQRWGRLHAGIDHGAPEGTPIYAPCDGEITQSSFQSGYGNVVQVTCQINGRTESYKAAHMRVRSPYRVGQRVRQGTQIGEVGNTGRSTGPHLHLEVRVNGRRIDPSPHLASYGIERQFTRSSCPMSVLQQNSGLQSGSSNGRRAVN